MEEVEPKMAQWS